MIEGGGNTLKSMADIYYGVEIKRLKNGWNYNLA